MIKTFDDITADQIVELSMQDIEAVSGGSRLSSSTFEHAL